MVSAGMDDHILTNGQNGVNGTAEAGDRLENIQKIVANDHKIKVAGIDCDGVMRGKIMSKDKFLSSIEKGFGMSSAIFGWDMHDVTYMREVSITSAKDGYRDFIAEIDLNSMRRLPFEDNIPFFLLRFILDGKPVCADGRGLVRSMVQSLAHAGFKGFAGVELEFMNFQTPSEDGYSSRDSHRDLGSYLEKNKPSALRPLTAGMFGYSATRPIMSKRYFHDIYDQSLQMDCPLEGWHTESGPGVYEAALAVSPVDRMADNVSIFKHTTKCLGVEHGVTPCFMAKPFQGLPGNSGHMHLSLTDISGKNVLARDSIDQDAPWSDIACLSDVGRHFLAGIIDALPDIMPLLAPNVNSYKRLIENYWAPVTVSWGLEDRLSSIRLIAPPTCKPSATRFEIRVPGADVHAHYALTAIYSSGLRGIERQMEVQLPPTSQLPEDQRAPLLPNTLAKALERFEAKDSIARQIMGDEFVDFFAQTRHHELMVWREAVTDWEFNRYIELV